MTGNGIVLGRPSKDSFFCTEQVWKDFRDFHIPKRRPNHRGEKSVDDLRKENPMTTSTSF